MAKKEKNNGFETKEPTSYSKEGVNLRDLIRFASGKQEGEEVTEQDFSSMLGTAGLSKRDSRRLTKAFQTVNKNQDLDYILSTDGKGFNVFNKKTGEAMTRSSKATGSTEGYNLADFVKLGDNVSTLAGFASRKIGDFLKPKDVAQEGPPAPDSPPETKGELFESPVKVEKPADTRAFSQAFAEARKGGLKDFVFNGKSYNTNLKSKTTSTSPAAKTPIESTETKPTGDFTGGGGRFRGSGASGGFDDVEEIDPVEDKKKGAEYGAYLKNRYSLMFDYIIKKDPKLTPQQKQSIGRDFDKLKLDNAEIYNYIKRHHPEKISGIPPYGGMRIPGGRP